MKSFHLAVLSLAAMAAPALAQTGHQHDAGGGNDRAFMEHMKTHEGMGRAMATLKPSGNADVDFVQMMIPHHQGAIDMAEVQLKYGRDPELRTLAERIIADQKAEIASMQKWLVEHGSH